MNMLPDRRLISSHDIDDRLIGAIAQRDLTTIRRILESNRYRSTIDQSLSFGLHRSDLNHPITPLAAACHFGSYDVVDILINDFHANVNKQHLPSWKTPLHYAVLTKSDRYEIIHLLIRHGVDVDAQDRYGTTALMLAVLHSHVDIVHLLLEQAGANVRLFNQYHLTAFDFVKRNVSIIVDLIRHGTLSFCTGDSNLFHWLIINKHARAARLLIEAGYTPQMLFFPQQVRTLKSLCRLKIRRSISGSHFRHRIEALPVNNTPLVKYLLLDDI